MRARGINAMKNYIYTVSLFLMLMGYTEVSARDWYFVESGGVDIFSGPEASVGTISNPLTASQANLDQFFAFNYGGSRNPDPGDQVYFRAGTYTNSIFLALANSGAAGNPVTISSYTGENAVFDLGYTGTTVNNAASGIGIFANNYTVQNLEIKNSQGSGITISSQGGGGNNINILDNKINNITGTGIAIYGGPGNAPFATVPTNILIQGNEVHDTVRMNSNHDTSGWNNAIGSGGNNVTIRQNSVYNNWGEGIIAGGSNNVVEENIVRDNFSANIYLDGAVNSTVQRNLTINSGNTNFYWTASTPTPGVLGPATGIALADENGGSSLQLNNNLITDNFVIGGKSGFYYGDFLQGGGFDNSRLINNTFYSTDTDMNTVSGLIHFDLAGGHTHDNSLGTNNIFFLDGPGGTLVSVAGGTNGLSFSQNYWSPSNTGLLSGSGDMALTISNATTIRGYVNALTNSSSFSTLLNGGLGASTDPSIFGGARFNFLSGIQSIPEPSEILLILVGGLMVYLKLTKWNTLLPSRRRRSILLRVYPIVIRKNAFLNVILITLITGVMVDAQVISDTLPYTNIASTSSNSVTWSNIKIGGGGYVTGVQVHPDDSNIVYMKTDVGGLYRWNAADTSWTPITDRFTYKDKDLYGIEGMAIDPNNKDFLYFTAGVSHYSTNNALFFSPDRGNTLERINFPTAPNLTFVYTNGQTYGGVGGNDQYRWAGERLMVDPNNSNYLFYATHRDGLLRYDRSTLTWAEMGGGLLTNAYTSVFADHAGITAFHIDKSSGTAAGSMTMYAGLYGANSNQGGIFQSTNGGSSWQEISTGLQPFKPLSFAQAGDSLIVGTDNDGLWKWNTNTGVWQQYGVDIGAANNVLKITNATTGQFRMENFTTAGDISGISVDQSNPNTMVISKYDPDRNSSRIYRTVDGGTNWERLDEFGPVDVIGRPGWDTASRRFTAGASDILIDPNNPNTVWFTEYAGIYRSTDINKANDGNTMTRPVFEALRDNHEEIVVSDLIKAPGKALILTAADMDGVRIVDPTLAPATQLGGASLIQNSYQVDFFKGNSDVLYRGAHGYIGTGSNERGVVLKSTNGGLNWSDISSSWTNHAGQYAVARKIAISATDSNRVVAIDSTGKFSFTVDGGASWSYSTVTNTFGTPIIISNRKFDTSKPLVADGVDEDFFYAIRPREGIAPAQIYRSTNGGVSFSYIQDHPRYISSADSFGLVTQLGMQGEFWAYSSGDPLYRYYDFGVNRDTISTVTSSILFSFGAAKPGNSNYSMYLFGKITGFSDMDRMWRSDDMGLTWLSMTDTVFPLGFSPNVLYGDWDEYGKIYVGSSGRGAWLGTLESVPEPSVWAQIAWGLSTLITVLYIQSKAGLKKKTLV